MSAGPISKRSSGGTGFSGASLTGKKDLRNPYEKSILVIVHFVRFPWNVMRRKDDLL
eukprot:TRINITY_DN7_c0_g1_i1.p2 TRINITY_DN7_c0_g1~~TRINITY_DN7_c0_g1_i1.p2  ORF type:complete len:57 (-),score=5.13 TRINITY_DN7_c0_g1_i1:220-390(-)